MLLLCWILLAWSTLCASRIIFRPYNRAQDVEESHLTVRNPAAVPKFDNAPKFAEASFPSQDRINAVATAILDCFKLVSTALEELSAPKPSPLFLRYFREDQYCDVRNTFSRLSGKNNFGPDSMPEYLTIYYRYNSAENKPGDVCDADPYAEAILYQWETEDGFWKAELVMCPYAFEPPSPESLQSVLDSKCESIKDRATYDMTAPGGAILHELLHWKEVTEGQGGFYVGDWNELPLFAPDPKASPVHGYGAWSASELNRVNGKGRENADSYSWYALEAFFTKNCKKEFSAPREEDFDPNRHPAGGDDRGEPKRMAQSSVGTGCSTHWRRSETSSYVLSIGELPISDISPYT